MPPIDLAPAKNGTQEGKDGKFRGAPIPKRKRQEPRCGDPPAQSGSSPQGFHASESYAATLAAQGQSACLP